MIVELVPMGRAEARTYIATHHRHSSPPVGFKFAIGLCLDGQLVGVAVASRPVARGADDGRTLEVTRLTTEGDRNACSRLYGAVCRAAAAMGYRRVISYTLEAEPGTSLRAAGFTDEGLTDRRTDRPWRRPDGLRAVDMPRLFDAPLMPTGPKRRWVRDL